ncbi:hypothetical protein [Psychrobacter sp.]|uniref:hypothetical protein n=1 Tax=Psychrobacter sp. TaxID=56811 RepID=UPI003C785234
MAILPKDYLSIYDVADYFNNLGYEYDLSISSDRYKIKKDIYDLILQDKITAVFYFFDGSNFNAAYYHIHHNDAYKLLIQNDAYIDVIFCQRVYRYDNGMKPDLEKDGEYTITESHYIKFEDIYIPKIELDKLFKIDTTQDAEKSKQLIAELQSELAQVKAQLEEQQQAPQRTRAQTDETNTDKKLIAMLAILLAKQSNTFRIGDRPNATQINEQVLNLTMQIVDELGMNENDTLGLKANTDKISKAVQAYADMFKLSKD